MKWILIVVGVIAGLIALMAIIGSLLPKGHTASRTTVINKAPDVLWQTMTPANVAASRLTGVR